MLLEISCDSNYFLNFLNEAIKLQIKPDFSMRGESEFNGFGMCAFIDSENNE